MEKLLVLTLMVLSLIASAQEYAYQSMYRVQNSQTDYLMMGLGGESEDDLLGFRLIRFVPDEESLEGFSIHDLQYDSLGEILGAQLLLFGSVYISQPDREVCAIPYFLSKIGEEEYSLQAQALRIDEKLSESTRTTCPNKTAVQDIFKQGEKKLNTMGAEVYEIKVNLVLD